MPAGPPAEPSIELRLIETRGAGPAAPSPPTQPAPPATPPAATPPATPPQPPAPVPVVAPEALPLPPPVPPSPPVRTPASAPVRAVSPPVAPARPAEVNLGGGDDLTNALASGRDVLAAKVDAHWRNREPVYPPDAAARGERGAVTLLIHVGPDGLVSGIDVAETSGFIVLDRAAREAVRTWHFLPAVRDGKPVSSEMPLRVLFQMN